MLPPIEHKAWKCKGRGTMRRHWVLALALAGALSQTIAAQTAKAPAAAAAKTLQTPAAAPTETAKSVINAASKAMGVDGVNSIRFYGVAQNGNLGQNNNSNQP